MKATTTTRNEKDTMMRATTRLLGNLPTNELTQYPTGRWGFVGKVSLALSFARKDGQALNMEDESEIVRLAGFGGAHVTRPHTAYKSLSWDTKEAAKVAASQL